MKKQKTKIKIKKDIDNSVYNNTEGMMETVFACKIANNTKSLYLTFSEDDSLWKLEGKHMTLSENHFTTYFKYDIDVYDFIKCMFDTKHIDMCFSECENVTYNMIYYQKLESYELDVFHDEYYCCSSSIDLPKKKILRLLKTIRKSWRYSVL
jgi:hypothetical protein